MLSGSEVKVTCWLPVGRIESVDIFYLVHMVLSSNLMESFGSVGINS